MIELNLIKSRITIFNNYRKVFVLLKIGSLLLALALAFLIFRFAAVRASISACQKETAAIRQDISRNKKLLGVQELTQEWSHYYGQLLGIQTLVDQRTTWTLRLNELSARQPAGVYLNRLQIDTNEKGRFLTLDTRVRSADKKEFDLINEYVAALSGSAYFLKGASIVSHERLEGPGGSGEEHFKLIVPLPGTGTR